MFLMGKGLCTAFKAVAISIIKWTVLPDLVRKSFAIDANNSYVLPTFPLYSQLCLISSKSHSEQS